VTNKLKNFFLLILCVAVIGGTSCVSAQSGNGGDKILAAGKRPLRQSDINKIIEFYEWAFETRFTAGERERFQELSVEFYRQDSDAASKASDTLISVLAQVKTKNESQQQKMRESFNNDFVKDLRAGNDDASRFLLGVFERAQNGADGSSTNNGETVAVNSASVNPETSSDNAVSQSLVGKWTRSGGAGGARDATGKTLYNSGDDITFEFFADGTMQFLREKKTLSITQCRISEITKIPGSYTSSGDQLTMNLGTGTAVGTSSCEARGNFQKTLSASTTTTKFVVRKMESIFRPDKPIMLCLDDTKDDDCYHREVK
jgi:hypothetical protein